MSTSPAPYRATFVRLLGFLKPYRVGLVVSILLAVGSQAAQIALVWVTGRDVIDRALVHRDTHRLWVSVVAIVGSVSCGRVLMGGRRLISGRQALDVEMDMRSGLYAHLVRLSFGFYDRHQTGQLMSRASVDLQGVRFFLGYGLIFFFQNVLTVVSVTVVLFFFEWRLALIVLAVTPVLVVLAYRYSHVTHPTLRDVQQKLADVATVAEENIVGVHVVKAFAQEPAEQAKFTAPQRSASSTRPCARTASARRTSHCISFVPLLAQAARAARRRAHGLARLAHAGQLRRVQPLSRHARDAAPRARHVDRPGAARDRRRRAHLRGDRRARGDRRRAAAHASCPPGDGAIRFEHVSFEYLPDGRCCATSISRSRPARTIALIGHTGSGKTTLDLARPALLRRDRRPRDASTASTSATLKLDSLRRAIGVDRAGSVPLLGVGAGQHRVRPAATSRTSEVEAAARPRRRTSSSTGCRRATTR